jgi:glutamine amidotransferase
MLAIIKYNAGNIQSVLNAMDRLGVDAVVTDDAETLMSADKIIFPGVGAAGAAMKSLKEKRLDELIRSLKQPVLGICVGMQLLFEHSEEDDTKGLGIIPARVKKFIGGEGNKVPQIGWNTIQQLQSPLFKGIAENSYVYYVHSYYAEQNPFMIATTEYGIPYAGAVAKDHFYGVQFHTEKSAETGDAILKNFLSL